MWKQHAPDDRHFHSERCVAPGGKGPATPEKDTASHGAFVADNDGMSVATLKGTFDSFPLPDVLRLVAASEETGLLRVDSPGLGGRIFVIEGEITYATTRSDDRLINDLVQMEQISEEERDAIERRAVRLEDVLSTRPAVLDIFFRHQVIEVFVRLLAMTEGSYSFGVGVMTKHQTGYRIDVEAAIAAAAVRSAEWTEIRKLVPEEETSFRLAPAIEDAVSIDPGRWAMLAVLTEARTARQIAVALKIFEFEAARRLAELAEVGLIVVEEGQAESDITIVDAPQPEEPISEEAEMASEGSEEAVSETPDMTSEESAELLGSFVALAERPQREQAERMQTVEEPAAEEVADEEDVDIAKRWRKLRKDRRSEGD